LDSDDTSNFNSPDDQLCEDTLPDDTNILEFIKEISKQLAMLEINSLQQFIDVLSKLIAANTGIHEHVG
jgi:hypothetical protein